MENLIVSSQLVPQKNNVKTTNIAANTDSPGGGSATDVAPEGAVSNIFGKILAQQVAASRPSKDEAIIAIMKDKAKDTDASAVNTAQIAAGSPILFLDPNALPVQKFLAANASPVTAPKPAVVDDVPSALSAISGKELPASDRKPADIAVTTTAVTTTAVTTTAVTTTVSMTSDPETVDSKAVVQSFESMLAQKEAASQKDITSQANGLTVQPQVASTPVAGSNTVADQPTLTVPQRVGAEDWGSGLGDKVVWVVGSQTRGAEIHLNPPALGPLEVRVSITDGQANLSFMTHHASVREAIEAATPKLREMLGDTGISMGNVSVDVGSFSQQQPQQQASASGNSPNSSNPDAWMKASEGGEDTPVIQTFTTAIQSLRGRGVVDYFA